MPARSFSSTKLGGRRFPAAFNFNVCAVAESEIDELFAVFVSVVYVFVRSNALRGDTSFCSVVNARLACGAVKRVICYRSTLH